MKDSRKFAFLLPNTFTALNIACGFLSMIAAAEGKIEKACFYIFLGALFDSIDGRVARLTGTSSAFGEQFDSLSDLISFGLAPAFILFFNFFGSGNRVGVAVCFLFLICGALRLARFNINIGKASSEYFQGMPIPGAALGVISLTMVVEPSASYRWLFALYILLYALIMVSNLPFNSFKKSPYLNKKKKFLLFAILIALLVLYIYRFKFLFLLINFYVFSSLAYFLMNRSKFSNVFDWEDEEDEVV